MPTYLIETDVDGLPITSPLVYARELAAAEIRGEITSEERAWLSNNPMLWLRGLRHLRDRTSNVMGRDRVAYMAAWAGHTPSKEEPELRAAHRRATTHYQETKRRRLAFMSRLVDRTDEVAVMCGPTGIGGRLAGELVDELVVAIHMLDAGQTPTARLKLLRMAESLTSAYAHTEAPDNSQAAVAVMILPRGYQEGFLCRACRRAKVNRNKTTCPLCGQRHAIEDQRHDASAAASA